MKIGLIDVDGHSGFPNLALMKLSHHHKQIGDQVEWYDPLFGGHYDKVYISKVFSFTEDYLSPINADVVEKGGTGYDIHKELPQEIDRLQPDYSIYPQIDNKTAYGFLTRGCPNKCKWCIVPQKEGHIHPYMDVEEIAIEGRNKLILMDNNVVASEYGLKQLEKIIERKYRVDFNQAIDARLINDDIAKMLSRVRWLGYIRLGCDTHAQIQYCENVIQSMIKYGYKGSFMLYTMLHGTIEECYERVSRWRKIYGSRVACQSQPMLDFSKKVQNIPQWQKDMARWSNQHTAYGVCDFKDFQVRKGFKCGEYFTSFALSTSLLQDV